MRKAQKNKKMEQIPDLADEYIARELNPLTFRGLTPNCTPVDYKKGGAYPGCWVEEINSQTTWLAKFTLPEEHPLTGSVNAESIAAVKTRVTATLEKAAADAYSLYGHLVHEIFGAEHAFATPEHLLLNMPYENPYLNDHELFQEVIRHVNTGRAQPITDGLCLVSRKLPGYQDLANLLVKHDGGITDIGTALTNGRLPKTAIIDGHEVPIHGLLALLIAAILFADHDFIGGSFTNAGYYIVTDSSNNPLHVKVINIDAGLAFNPDAYYRFKRALESSSADTLKFRFANQSQAYVLWELLSHEQKSLAKQYLQLGLTAFQQHNLYAALLERPVFNKLTSNRTLLCPNLINEKLADFVDHISNVATAFKLRPKNTKQITHPTKTITFLASTGFSFAAGLVLFSLFMKAKSNSTNTVSPAATNIGIFSLPQDSDTSSVSLPAEIIRGAILYANT